MLISPIAAKSEDGLEEVADLARTEIVPSIAAIEGVASADVTGGLEKQLLVTLDPDAMSEAGVSVQQIQGVLQANKLKVGDYGIGVPELRPESRYNLDNAEIVRKFAIGVNTLLAVPCGSDRPRVARALAEATA